MAPKLWLKVVFLLVWSALFPETLLGQIAVRGLVIDKAGASRVGSVAITNQNRRITSMSNELGLFSIMGGIGDTLRFSKPGYTEFIQVLRSSDDLIIRLQPVIQLGEVRVEGQSKAQELAEYREQYRKNGSYYGGKPPLASYFLQPVTALYELLGKTPGQARRFNEFYAKELQQTEIDRRFNEIRVKELTGLDSTDLKHFMNLYRPDYETLSKMDDYSLILYIRKSYSNFEALGRPNGQQNLPPLPKAKDLTERNLRY